MDTPEAETTPQHNKQSRTNLTPKTKTALVCMLKDCSEVKKTGKCVLPKAAEAAAMEKFGVSKGQCLEHSKNSGSGEC